MWFPKCSYPVQANHDALHTEDWRVHPLSCPGYPGKAPEEEFGQCWVTANGFQTSADDTAGCAAQTGGKKGKGRSGPKKGHGVSSVWGQVLWRDGSIRVDPLRHRDEEALQDLHLWTARGCLTVGRWTSSAALGEGCWGNWRGCLLPLISGPAEAEEHQDRLKPLSSTPGTCPGASLRWWKRGKRKSDP